MSHFVEMANALALKSRSDDKLASEIYKRDCDEFEERSDTIFLVETLFKILKASVSAGIYGVKEPSAPYPFNASHG